MKAWTIAWKDTLIRLRDRNALILVLVAPLLISAIMGLALRGFVGAAPARGTPLLLIVNDDADAFGASLAESLGREGSGRSFKTAVADDFAAARRAVADGKAQAALHLPRGLSAGLRAAVEQDRPASPPAPITLYAASDADDAREAVELLVGRLNANLAGRRVAAEQVSSSFPGSDGARAGLRGILDEELHVNPARPAPVKVELQSSAREGGEGRGVNPFAFFAPSLAIFFLMISMFESPRSILLEQEDGTLGRLIRAPINPKEILLGKIGGTYLTGILQFTLLVLASRLIFDLRWGSSLAGLALMVVAVVTASASMGAVVAAFSKDVLQAGALGGAITLLSAGLGGNFFAADRMPGYLQVLSRLTINRWALEGFSNLTVKGLGLREVLPDAFVLLGLAAALFILAFWKFQKKFAG
jgi:ABC-2 type transport system permease protein